jgi:UPF0755 protein
LGSLIRTSLVIAVVALAAALVVAGFAWRWMDRPVVGTEPVIIEIPRGASFRGFARMLADAGLIDRPEVFRWYARLAGLSTEVRAGEYQFVPGQTPRQVLAQAVAGRVLLHTVTIVEGWTVARMLDELSRRDELAHTVTHHDAGSLMVALGIDEPHAEGWFFPDTYSFPRGTTDAAILRQAHARMRAHLEDVWAARQIGLPLASPYDALILASVIEKETGRADERPKVSQVFNKRLSIGMRLQTDPTVIYGFGNDFDGRLRRHHLRTDHPYNTYRRHGLPPRPISPASRGATTPRRRSTAAWSSSGCAACSSRIAVPAATSSCSWKKAKNRSSKSTARPKTSR